MPADLDLVRRLVSADHGLVVVSTTRPDGSVHSSVVNAAVLADPITGGPAVCMVLRGGVRKLDLLRRNGQATVAFRAGWEWAAVDGPVRIIGPDDPEPGFDPADLPGLLRAIFTAAGGTHEDFAEFDRVMAAERRAAVLVTPARILGNG
jgi:PPOX class probable F420-dependent enzyme